MTRAEIQARYDEFFGTGLWERDYKPHIVIFAEQCLMAQEQGQNLPIHNVMPSLHSIEFKKLRKAKGLTLREVEERTGISNAYLSQLETGKIKSPGYDIVKALYELYSNEA